MIDWSERVPLVMRFVAVGSKRFVPKDSVCMVVLSVMVTACRPAYGLAYIIVARNQFILRENLCPDAAVRVRWERVVCGRAGM